jgi:hypothetical protein
VLRYYCLAPAPALVCFLLGFVVVLPGKQKMIDGQRTDGDGTFFAEKMTKK